MLTIDKIKKNVPEIIIKTINDLVNNNEKELLELWLKDCITEIARRTEAKEEIKFLHYEKVYLEAVLNNK